MSYPHLLKPITVGKLALPNRVFMAPLTRCRADLPGHIPSDMMAEMYAQRAGAGLLIAEATMVQKGHSGFHSEPGVFSDEQVEGWKKTTSKVHAQGGKIFLQICHCGRAAHSVNDHEQPMGPSAVAIEGHGMDPLFNAKGEKLPFEVPRAIPLEEIPQVVEAFRVSALNGIAAGFDGIEVHGANGYLLDEFLREGANQRTDKYGGSIENRARLLLEVTAAICDAVGRDRVGVRISPLNSFNAMTESNPEKLTRYIAAELSKMGIAYLHLLRADFFGVLKGDAVGWCRDEFKGVLVSNLGYEAKEADSEIASGRIDAVAFGTKFLANPDLVDRLKLDKPLNELRPQFFYTRGTEGYVDYPTLQA